MSLLIVKEGMLLSILSRYIFTLHNQALCYVSLECSCCVIYVGDRVTGGWRKLHNEELHNLYSSPSIIRIIKSRRLRWVGHVA
jgi:hypothetical protein